MGPSTGGFQTAGSRMVERFGCRVWGLGLRRSSAQNRFQDPSSGFEIWVTLSAKP